MLYGATQRIVILIHSFALGRLMGLHSLQSHHPQQVEDKYI